MVLFGADVSGEDNAQHRVVAFVIGTDDSINSIHSEIGFRRLHMRELKKDRVGYVRRKIHFQDKDRFAFSFVIDKMNTIHEMHNDKKTTDKFSELNLIFKEFDKLLLKMTLPRLQIVAGGFNVKLEDLRMQVDEDMKHTAKHWGWKYKTGGKAHDLADVVAYCHNKGHQIPGWNTYDISIELYNEIRVIIRK